MLEKVLKSVEKLDKKISRLEKEAAGETRELVNNAIESGENLEQIEEDYEAWEYHGTEIDRLKQLRDYLLSDCANLTPDEKVFLARHQKRPHIDDFIEGLFTDFF